MGLLGAFCTDALMGPIAQAAFHSLAAMLHVRDSAIPMSEIYFGAVAKDTYRDRP
jgi:hypothetical protein